MNEIIYMILALITGLILGIFFFGGLWFTVKKAMTAKTPALWFVGSFIIRVGITLIGFYFISLGNWKRMVVCLIGFIIARFVVMRLTKAKDLQQAELKKEVGNGA